MERKKSRWSFFTSGYLILVLAFIYLPILYVMVFSFNDSKSMIAFEGFSLRWYEAMFANREMLESIYYTVVVALIATAVTLFFGQWIYAMLGLGLYYVVIGFAFTRFVHASFTNGVFDRFINSRIEGVQINRGLAKEEDEDFTEEDEPTDDIQA